MEIVESMGTVRRWTKKRISYIHFGYYDFHDFDNFIIKLLEGLKEDQQYSLLLKINYDKEKYAMAPKKQVGFKYVGDDIEKFENLHNTLKKIIDNVLDNYDVTEVNSVQLLYVLVDDLPELKLKNVNKIGFNKKFMGVKDVKGIKDRFNLIPLTVNMNYFGKLIIDDRSLYLSRINEQREILNDEKLLINDEDKLYLYNGNIIINRKKNDIYYRSVYDPMLGNLISEMEDIVINDNHFIRKIGNTSLTIIKDKIVKVESEKKLYPIKYISRLLKDEANPHIGSWDIEAFNDIDGDVKVYALGFVTMGEKPLTYYLDNNTTSEQLVLNCLNDMLVNKYNGYTFYTHNFGRYDSIFLIKILKEENLRLGYEYYKLKELCRDKKILKLVIKVKRSLSDRTFKKDKLTDKKGEPRDRKDPGFNSITIVDSLNILNQSLDKLCISFNVPVTKGKFPHSFVKRDTINYIGNTPDKKYWEDISIEDYNKLIKSDWSLKYECLKYLEKDLVSLVMIISKFSEYINRKYHLQLTECLTISRLALNIFLKDYLNGSKLPIISKNMFGDIKEAYYGGVTEVYKPYGKNLLHYDVNSLYPFAALNPMPGINCTFIENIENSVHLKDLFGYFYCEVETSNNYFGLLPVHSEEGLLMPVGTWKGWYFSEELKYASEKGYKIKILKGYNFSKVHDVFTGYVNDLYQIKSTTSDKVEKDIVKRLLNHLLGRFGLDITKFITRCVNGKELSEILSTRERKGLPIQVTEDDYWITYSPKIDQEICEEHGIDYIKALNLTSKSDIEKVNEFRDVSLTTAAAVTGYARIYMSKIKESILEKGGNIYYTDTDSIVTDIPLDDSLIGNELGKFKLEYKKVVI